MYDAEFHLINQNSFPPPARCVPAQLSYCSGITSEYNLTSYPNLIGHLTIDEVSEDLISYRFDFNSVVDFSALKKKKKGTDM